MDEYGENNLIVDGDKMRKITKLVKESIIRHRYKEISNKQLRQALEEFGSFWSDVKLTNNFSEGQKLEISLDVKFKEEILNFKFTL